MSTSEPAERPATAPPGRLVIVCGLPGSGKTTHAVRLARELQGLRLAPDEWLAALGASVWDAPARERVEALQWAVTTDLLRVGTTVVLEWGTWTRAERDRLRSEARALGASVELCPLAVPLAELWRRIRARDAEDPPVSWSDLQQWWDCFEPPTDEELADYDVVHR